MQVDTLNALADGFMENLGHHARSVIFDDSIGDFLMQYRELAKGFEIDREWLRSWDERTTE